jgi:hypothetical protein
MKTLESAILESTVKDIDTALVVTATRLSWAFQKETFSRGTKVLGPIVKRLIAQRNKLTTHQLVLDEKTPIGLIPSVLNIKTTAKDYEEFSETSIGSVLKPLIEGVLND